MREFGAEIAARLSSGDVLLLHGDLGAGKTTLSQGIARGFGISQPITSPTFTIVSEYRFVPSVNGISRLAHLDLYRLTDPEELDSFGFDEYLGANDAVSVIEWPERAGTRLPSGAIVIEIAPDGADRRRLTIRRLIPEAS